MKEYSIKGLQQQKDRQADEYGSDDEEQSKEEEWNGSDLSGEFSWIQSFNQKNLNDMVVKIEDEKRVAQSKKNTGSITAKKNQQKIMQINYRLTQAKKLKGLVDEFLCVPPQLIQAESIQLIKSGLEQFEKNPDDERNRNSLEQQMTKVKSENENSVKQVQAVETDDPFRVGTVCEWQDQSGKWGLGIVVCQNTLPTQCGKSTLF